MFFASALAAPLTGVTDLVPGSGAACALDTAGALWCWGDGYGPRATRVADQVAAAAAPDCWVHRDGRTACEAHPSEPFPPDAIQLVQRRDRLCGLGADGAVRCVGSWAEAFGGPRGVDRRAPTVVPGLAPAAEITPSGCVRRPDGRVVCATPRGPQEIAGLRAITFGRTLETCAIAEDHAAWCWSDGFPPRKEEPNASWIAGLPGASSCKVDAGRVWCWSPSRSERRPIQAAGGPLTAAGPVVVGRGFGCAVTPDATVACWGPAAADWWGEPATAAWPITTAPSSGRSRVASQPVDCALVERRVRCEPPSPFDSPTAPVVALDDIDTFEAGASQSCATRGTTLLCFGQAWVGSADEGPGVVAFADVADFAMEGDDLLVVHSDGRVRWHYDGLELHVLELDATRIALGSDVTCADTRDARTVCWSRWSRGATTITPRELAVPAGEAGGIEVRWGDVCVAGTELCADNEVPTDDRAVVVDVAP